MAEPKLLIPEEKLAEAQALWEISMLYIALGAAARTMVGGTQASGTAAAGGYRASQLLARAYYRLIRAAWTGYTIADRGDEAGSKTSLRDLYSDFETLAYRSIPKSQRKDVEERVRIAGHNYRDAMRGLLDDHEVDLSTDDDRYSSDRDLIDAAEEVTPEDGDDYAADATEDRDWDNEQRIIVERLKEAEEHLREAEEAERQELADLEKRIKEIDKQAKKMAAKAKAKKQAKQARKIQEAKDRGRRAGAAMKAAQQGGRTEISSIASKDSRAKGFIVVPRGPQPCYWCLMLASRGVILYKSRSSAAAGLWHDNCKCDVEPVFSMSQYFDSPVFERNRAAHIMWQREMAKKGTSDLKDWRRYVESTYRDGKDFDTLLRENARR